MLKITNNWVPTLGSLLECHCLTFKKSRCICLESSRIEYSSELHCSNNQLLWTWYMRSSYPAQCWPRWLQDTLQDKPLCSLSPLIEGIIQTLLWLLWLVSFSQRHEGHWEQGDEGWGEDGAAGDPVEGGQTHCRGGWSQIWGGEGKKNNGFKLLNADLWIPKFPPVTLLFFSSPRWLVNWWSWRGSWRELRRGLRSQNGKRFQTQKHVIACTPARVPAFRCSVKTENVCRIFFTVKPVTWRRSWKMWPTIWSP